MNECRPHDQHRLVPTDDPEPPLEVRSLLLERHRTESRDPDVAVDSHPTALRHCSLVHVDSLSALNASCAEPRNDTFRLLLPTARRIGDRIPGEPAKTTPLTAVLHAPGQDLRPLAGPSRTLVLGVDGAFVRRALSRRFGHVPGFETWAVEFPLALPAVASLSAFCQWLARELDRPNSLLHTDRRAIDRVERTLLDLFIEMLTSQHPVVRAATEDLAHRQVARIEAWIDANLAEPIGVEDLAAVVDLSTRSIQIAFRRLRGCTPMQFVLRRRLERAHALLHTPTPETTVTHVALECGFSQFGRFAVQYRALFGEKPSQTLGRTRASRALPSVTA